MRDHREDTKRAERIDACVGSVREVVEMGAARYARRFRIERLREEIAAESIARLVEAAGRGREPLGRAPRTEAEHEALARFATGLVANVAREALRGAIRQARPARDERVRTAAMLAMAGRAPGVDAELREEIARALGRLVEMDEGSRATLVAEEAMRNGYTTGEIRALSERCRVGYEGVLRMIERKGTGAVSGEAWRQRVSRSRKRARALLGAAAVAVALSAALVIAGGFASASAADPVVEGSTQNGSLDPAPAPVELASTQNGGSKDPGPELASTQNGGSKDPGPVLASTQNGGKKGPGAALASTQNGGKKGPWVA